MASEELYSELKKHKRKVTCEQELEHERHIGILNGLLNTAKSALDMGYEIPQEISHMLISYLHEQANGGEGNIVHELKALDLDDLLVVKKEEYERIVCYFLQGHEAGREDLQKKPKINRLASILRNCPVGRNEANEDYRSAFSGGYRQGFAKKRLYKTNVENYLLEHFDCCDKTMEIKVKDFKVDRLIGVYIAEQEIISKQ